MTFVKALVAIVMLFPFMSCEKEGVDGIPDPGADPSQTMVTTLAGTPGIKGFTDGLGNAAKFSGPRQMILDTRPNPNYPNGALFVVDQGFNGLVIRAVDPVNGSVSTYVDDERLWAIGDVILDTRVNEGGALLITDTRINVVYQVRPNAFGKGVLTPIAGGNGSGDADGSLAVAQLSGPSGLVVDNAGKIYVFSSYYKTLKKIDLEAGTMTKFAGRPLPLGENHEPADGAGINARLGGNVSDLALSADGRTIYFVDWFGQCLRTVNIADAEVTTHIPYRPKGAQAGPFSGIALAYPDLVAANGSNTLFFTAIGFGTARHGSAIFMADFSRQQVYTIVNGGQGYKDGNGREAQFNSISGIAVSADGKTLYVSDLYNNVIRKVVRS